jgi:hypothetical protein
MAHGNAIYVRIDVLPTFSPVVSRDVSTSLDMTIG